jgi:hypothetical protein
MSTVFDDTISLELNSPGRNSTHKRSEHKRETDETIWCAHPPLGIIETSPLIWIKLSSFSFAWQFARARNNHRADSAAVIKPTSIYFFTPSIRHNTTRGEEETWLISDLYTHMYIFTPAWRSERQLWSGLLCSGCGRNVKVHRWERPGYLKKKMCVCVYYYVSVCRAHI